MREPKEAEICGHIYQVSMLQATRGWRLMLKVAKMVGPSIGIVVDGMGLSRVKAGDEGFLQKIADEDLGSKFFENAITVLMTSVNESDLQHVINELASATKFRWNRDGVLSKYMPLAGDNFEIHFSGNQGLMIQWLAFAMKSQFADFSDVLGNAVMLQGDLINQAADQ